MIYDAGAYRISYRDVYTVLITNITYILLPTQFVRLFEYVHHSGEVDSGDIIGIGRTSYQDLLSILRCQRKLFTLA